MFYQNPAGAPQPPPPPAQTDFRQLLTRLNEKVDTLTEKVSFILLHFQQNFFINRFSSIQKIPQTIQTWKRVFYSPISNESSK